MSFLFFSLVKLHGIPNALNYIETAPEHTLKQM